MNTKTKSEELTTMGLKRLVTELGRIQDKIAPDLAAYEKLEARIKHELLARLDQPGDTISMVSGEYIAAFSAERKGRVFTPAIKHEIIDDLGLPVFIELVTVPAGTLKTAYVETGMSATQFKDQLDTLAPAEFTGSGRSFKLSKRS